MYTYIDTSLYFLHDIGVRPLIPARTLNVSFIPNQQVPIPHPTTLEAPILNILTLSLCPPLSIFLHQSTK